MAGRAGGLRPTLAPTPHDFADSLQRGLGDLEPVLQRPEIGSVFQTTDLMLAYHPGAFSGIPGVCRILARRPVDQDLGSGHQPALVLAV